MTRSDPPASTPGPPTPARADDPRVAALRRLVGIVDRLRDPDGCPWDREQTAASMAPCVVEEAHELREAIEAGDDGDLCEEAGDVLMALTLLCRIEEQAGRPGLAEAAERVADKLVRRHPHVFGDARADDAEEVLARWETIKRAERVEGERDASALAGVPATLPALQRAARLCGKAVASGFRWRTAAGALDKLGEEIGELREVLAGALDGERVELDEPTRERAAAELGDVLMAGAFLGQYLGLDPERACRDAQRRFERRFRRMEAELSGDLAARGFEELVGAWARAKRADAAREGTSA